MTDNEFLLFDRLEKIKSVIKQYGEENFYVSFSGGKDSTVLSALIDMAIPGNKIPRVYANTGIEYRLILDFVERERERKHSWELFILKPKVPIKQTLEEVGYPFKSKGHSQILALYQKRKTTDNSASIQHYLHISDDGKCWSREKSCPDILRYQFTPEFTLKVSDKCCERMKEKPLLQWQKEHGIKYSIIGIMAAEGGRRSAAKCLAFRNNKLTAFQPLAPMTKDWEDWFIDKHNIAISDIYKPPYNFVRTGCKGCPFGLELQAELDALEIFFPNERKQCERIWAPVYEEYRHLGYRLRKKGEYRQITIDELMNGG